MRDFILKHLKEETYNQLNTQKFIEKSKLVHGDKYDYSLSEYKNSLVPVKIICPFHGEFEQIPKTHMKGGGCKECGKKKSIESRTLDVQDFIKKANLVHDNKYQYDKVDYKNSLEKVIITCPKHGDFSQLPNNHLRGSGCPKCGTEERVLQQKTPLNVFIDQAQKVHNNKYDYSNVDYVNNRTKVAIKCDKHGMFYQTPNAHLRGQGCSICGNEQKNLERRLTTQEIIQRAKEVHGDTYDYSDTIYELGDIPVKIICKKHGPFYQTAGNHINNEQGCPICGRERTSEKQRGNTQDFIRRAIATHGNKYDYSQSKFGRSNKDLITIICPTHGAFYQTPISHISGQGCPKCANNIKKTTQQFIDLAKKTHGNKFDYSLTNFLSGKDKVTIICPIHGQFSQLPNNHLRGSGCPSCSESRGERYVSFFLEENNILFERQKKFEGCFRFSNNTKRCYRLPFDFYLPNYNSVIEYDGIQHFEPVGIFGGQKAYESAIIRDRLKTEYCNKNNIPILRLPYTLTPEEIQSTITRFLNL